MLRAPTSCPDCGQPSVQGGRYCAKHVTNNTAATARRDFDKLRRANSPHRSWYGSAFWRNLKAQFFIHNPTNAQCAAIDQRTGQRCVLPATEVDHIIPHRGVWSVFADIKNLQGLCSSHHSKKTGRGE